MRIAFSSSDQIERYVNRILFSAIALRFWDGKPESWRTRSQNLGCHRLERGLIVQNGNYSKPQSQQWTLWGMGWILELSRWNPSRNEGEMRTLIWIDVCNFWDWLRRFLQVIGKVFQFRWKSSNSLLTPSKMLGFLCVCEDNSYNEEAWSWRALEGHC
jgi:hypothetical protein